MRRYLVVAHRTLGGPHLVAELHRCREDDPYCSFHLLVPEFRPTRHGWSDREVRVAATVMLDTMLERLAEMRIGATGEVTGPNPVQAIGDVLHRDGNDHYVGVILSTLPSGLSKWLLLDVPRRIEVAYPRLPLTHIVADEELVERWPDQAPGLTTS